MRHKEAIPHHTPRGADRSRRGEPFDRPRGERRASSERLGGLLLAVLLGLFAALGVAPLDREVWLLENVLFVAALAFLVASRRWLPLSNGSCLLIFVFLTLHEVGAHYTYSLVPYERWWQRFVGAANAPEEARNHYDRFVHFAFGVLLAYPMRELLLRTVAARGIASYVLPAQMVLSWSALYELIEWAAAIVFGNGTGTAYVGTQGDAWDAQKDMLLALTGAVIAMALTASLHSAHRADRQRRGLARRLAAVTAHDARWWTS